MDNKIHWKKNIILFLASQIVSIFGSSLVQYAIMWHITLTTQSGIMMTISIICGFLPTFFLSPFAGVWADRYNRKLLIVLADAMIAVATLILAILFLQGHYSIWMLFIASAVRAVGAGVQTPAVGALIPQIVPEEQLTRVNAINGSIQSMVMLVSPMLSGALLTMSTIEVIFFIDVVTAAIAIAILLFFLNVPTHEKAKEAQAISYFADLGQGFAYIRKNDYIMRFFQFCALFFILVSPVAFLTPLQVARSFGEDVWRLTAIEITFAVGMMLGGVVMASWGGFKNRIHTMAFSAIVMGLCTIILGWVPLFSLYLLFMGIWGIVMPFFNTPSTVLLQERVEEAFMGRVFGVLGMINSVMMPIGMLIFGPLADIIKIEVILLSTGALIVILGIMLVRNRPLVAAGWPINRDTTLEE